MNMESDFLVDWLCEYFARMYYFHRDYPALRLINRKYKESADKYLADSKKLICNETNKCRYPRRCVFESARNYDQDMLEFLKTIDIVNFNSLRLCGLAAGGHLDEIQNNIKLYTPAIKIKMLKDACLYEQLPVALFLLKNITNQEKQMNNFRYFIINNKKIWTFLTKSD